MMGVETKVRRGCLEAARSTLLPLRKAIGASFEAIVEIVYGWRGCVFREAMMIKSRVDASFLR